MPWNFNAGSPMLNNSDQLELRINIVDANATKTLLLDPEMPIYQICEVIRKNNREAQTKHPKNYGLFLPHDDCRRGLWLDVSKTLQHYIIRRGDTLEYRNKFRFLHIRTMDGIKKELKVDDSWTVSELMLTICSKLGIYNYDEYSLISEDHIVSPNADKTLSMKRPLSVTKDQDKLDKLKKKYHTEDGLNWLNPSQSLRQQGIDESESLLVKRKYFFSDMNVDSQDPIQLSLLYVQLKDAVLNGTHPVTLDEAIELGGIQCQIQFGNYSADNFKPGFLDLREFLPKEYLKSFKNVEKKIFVQHAKMKDNSEVAAKEKYCLMCRSFKTYGITFFLVKEKVKGKNKLIPRLLGVNKDSVVQVDEKSKEIINKWPLTSIKKWAASFSGFTMDFGEYSPDEYYTAQTDKGERISQLIAGYIDIILKRKKTKDHLAMDADEESVIQEETVAPSKAVIVEHVPKLNRPSVSEEDVVIRKSARTVNSSVRYSSQASDSLYSQDANMSQEEIMMSRQTSVARTQSPDSSAATNSLHYRMSDEDIKHRLYIMSLQDNLKAIESYKDQLDANEGPVLGKDEASQKWIYTNIDNSRQRMADEIGAMNAAVAQVIRSAQGLATIEEGEEEEMNEEMIAKMQNSFSLITVHLPSLMEEVKTSAYYQDQLMDDGESGEELIAAAKRLADAFTNLIKAAYPLEEHDRNLNRKAIFDAANAVGEASSDLLQHISEQETSNDETRIERPVSIVFISEQDQSYQEELLRMAKAVANATTNLIKQVKIVAVEAEDPDDQKKVVTAATDTGMAISQLIATTKIVAPTIEQPVCQEQLMFSVEDVDRAIQVVVKSANKATQSEDLQNNTNIAAKDVQEALDNLMHHLRKDNDKNTNLDCFLLACEHIQELDVEDEDPNRLIEAARKLAQATADMISEIQMKAQSEETNDEEHDKLIHAARQLAEATTVLVDSAKICRTNPEELRLRYTLREAVERFIIITYTTECADILQEQVIDHLLAAARKAATASTHLINTSQSATKKSRASNYKVCSDGQDVANRIPRLILTIKEARRDPKDNLTQLELISACQEFVEPSEQLAQSSKYMWPTISDASLQNALNQSIKQSVNATDELKKCLQQADSICQHLDLSAALEQLKRLQETLKNIKNSIERENLIPLPDEQAEESASLLIRSVRQSGSAANQLKHDMEDRCLTYDQNPGEDKYLNINNLDSVGKKARELSSRLDKLVHAARGVAASIELESQDELNDIKVLEKEAQLKIIKNCLSAVEAAYDLVYEAKVAPPESDQMNRIQVASVLLSDALSRCLDSLPGQRDLDILEQYIDSKKHKFAVNKLPLILDPTTDVKGYQSQLTDATFAFNQGVNELASAQSFNVVNRGCRKLRSSYDTLVDTSNAMILNPVSNGDSFNRNHSSKKDGVINCVMVMSNDSQSFINCVKRSQCEPDNMELRRKLQEEARTLLDSVNRLLATSSSNVRPGQKECDKAILRMESVRPILDNPVHPVSHKDYYGSLDFIVDKTVEPLAESLKIIPAAVKDENNQKFIDAIYQCADCVCLLLEETAQAAYLIGIGDVHSKVGKSGLADHSLFLQIQKEISDNCSTIYDPETTARQMINTAANIAENCKKLCEASKTIMVSFPKDKIKLSDKTKATLISVSDLMTGVQKLNSEFCEENRANVEQLSEKVLANVAELVELMFSYNFAGDTAYISDEAKEAQAPIKAAGITVLDTAIDVVRSSKDLISQEPNENLYFNYSSNCKDFNDALKQLILIIKESAPGQKECERALKLVAKLLRQVRDSEMKIMKNRSRVPQKDSESEETYQKVLQSVLLQMPHCIDDLSKAGKKEPEQLAHVLSRQTQLLETMTESCIGAAAHVDLVQNSTIYLEHVATVLEATEQFLRAVKKCGGNPKATAIHSQIDEMAQGVKESCGDLLATLDKISVKEDDVKEIIETINQSKAKVQQSAILPEGTKFSNAQSKMLDICYAMNDITSDISNKAFSDSTQRLMSPLANKLTQNYGDLCQACQNAVAILNDDKKRKSLQECVKSVGASSINLVKSTSDVRPTISTTVQQLQTRSKDLHKRIDELIQVIIDSNAGTQACNEAIRILKEVNKDLNTTKMNMQTTSDNPLDNAYHDPNDSFIKIKNSVISSSNSLVYNIKEIVNKDDSNIERLIDNANEIALTTKRLADQVQSFIEDCRGSSPEYNIELLNAIQEVDQALINILEEARSSCDLHYNDPSHKTLQDKGKICVHAVTELLKVLKTLNEDNTKGLQAIDKAIQEIEKESINLSQTIREATPTDSIDSSHRLSMSSDVTISPRFASEEIKRMIPSLSNAASKILEVISPHKSSYQQEDVIAASLYCTKINKDLATSCKNLLNNGQQSDSKLKTIETANEIIDNYAFLLKNLRKHLNNPSKFSQNDIVNSTRQIAELIKSLHHNLESLREGPRLVMYFRPSSPEWRDVSEKYIGRHVAYHHCYVKSYSLDSQSSLHNQSPSFVQVPLNLRDPSDMDVDNVKKQIRYITTKLHEIKPNPSCDQVVEGLPTLSHYLGSAHISPRTKSSLKVEDDLQLIGIDKYTVAELDQMLTYVKDLGITTEGILSTSQKMCKQYNKDALNEDTRKNIYRSAIGVANAMKELCEVTNSSLTSESLSNTAGERLCTATKKVANSTGQLLLNLKPTINPNEQQIKDVHIYGKRIKADADLLLNHISYLGEKGAASKSNNTYVMLSMNESNGRHSDSKTEPIQPECSQLSPNGVQDDCGVEVNNISSESL